MMSVQASSECAVTLQQRGVAASRGGVMITNRCVYVCVCVCVCPLTAGTALSVRLSLVWKLKVLSSPRLEVPPRVLVWCVVVGCDASWSWCV